MSFFAPSLHEPISDERARLHAARQRRRRATPREQQVPDGVIEPGMTLCVESCVGAEDGGCGVKLEQHLLVDEQVREVLSTFPFDDALEIREACP